ncbi:MAG: aminoacyl-tRNA hydrolase [Vampirovibrionia bacterium]
MYLIAGLGNPGAQYEATRHNIGFRIISNLAEKHKIDGNFSQKFNAIVGKGTIKGIDTILVEPLTFMNLSGNAILKILNWYKIDHTKMLIIYDDIDLNLGRLRFKDGGSDGGHNGIKSIIEQLGGKQNFDRLRVGIGPGPNGPERKNFVLGKFLPEQQTLLSESIKLASQGVELYLKSGLQEAMNKYNGINLAAPPKKKKQRITLFIDHSFAKIEKEIFLSNNVETHNISNTIFPVDIPIE